MAMFYIFSTAVQNTCFIPRKTPCPCPSISVINFDDFVKDTEGVMRDLLGFVGVDPDLFDYKPLPPGMKVNYILAVDNQLWSIKRRDLNPQNNYEGRRMHPSVKASLTELYKPSVWALYRLLGRDLGWEGFHGCDVTPPLLEIGRAHV